MGSGNLGIKVLEFLSWLIYPAFSRTGEALKMIEATVGPEKCWKFVNSNKNVSWKTSRKSYMGKKILHVHLFMSSEIKLSEAWKTPGILFLKSAQTLICFGLCYDRWKQVDDTRCWNSWVGCKNRKRMARKQGLCKTSGWILLSVASWQFL